MEKDLNALENIIGYKFKNREILLTAITHSSYAYDYLGDANLGNERLEFLGDAILDMVVGAELFVRFPKEQEGFLSKLRAEIVCEASLAEVARKTNLNEYLRLGHGEESTGGREKNSIIADMVESVIAAVYADGGIESAISCVHHILDETIDKGCNGGLPKDVKTMLQEYCQGKFGVVPIYKIIGESGPAHDKLFTAAVFINEKEIGKGVGKTKKDAQIDAAGKALKNVTSD